MKKRFDAFGAEAAPSTSEAFGTFIRNDIARWRKVIKDGNLILPEGPGIGLTLDAKKLAKYRVDK